MTIISYNLLLLVNIVNLLLIRKGLWYLHSEASESPLSIRIYIKNSNNKTIKITTITRYDSLDPNNIGHVLETIVNEVYNDITCD